MKIIVFNQKHGDWYFVANTPEQIRRAKYTVLKQNNDYGWYYPPEAPKFKEDPRKGLSDEEIFGLPKSLRDPLMADIAKYDQDVARQTSFYEQELEYYELLQKVLEMPIDEAIKVTTKTQYKDKVFERNFIDEFMDGRGDGGYEGFYTEIVDEP